jgi:excisionase family DNA binding protein
VSDLDHLRRPDGSVLVPAEIAGGLLRLAVLGLRELVRRDGGAVAPELHRLLYALHEAAEAAEAPEVEPATTCACGSSRAGYVIVAEASGLLDCSPSWVRFLARRGVLQATRAGRDWLIDRASLDAYRHGRTAA